MPPRVTVVGLGPGDPALRTVAAQRALDVATRIVLRTRIHPGLADLAADPRAVDCDDLYEGLTTFDAVYAAVADRVLAEAARAGATVALPRSTNARRLAEIVARLARPAEPAARTRPSRSETDGERRAPGVRASGSASTRR